MFHQRSDNTHKLLQSGVMSLAAVLILVLVAGVATESRAAEAPELRPIHAPYDKTVVVAPVPGSPEASGKALIAALKEIHFRALKENRFSKTDRWLVKLEPGVFDLGQFPLVLEPGIDMEGSGALQTEIVGLGQDYYDPSFSFHKGVVVGADDVELRNLTIRCENTNHFNACIAMSNHRASPRLIGVRLLATDPQGEAHWGLRNDQSSPELDDVEILVANGANNYAVVNTFSSSRPEIRGSSLTAQDGSGQNIGILNKVEALPALRDVEIGVIGGDLAAGVWSIDTEELEVEPRGATLPSLEMFDVDIEARDGAENFGVLGGRFTLELRRSRVTIDRGSALDIGPYGNVDVRNSELRATDYLAHAGNVRIVATWLRGGGDVMGYGEETCSGVHTDEGTTNVCP